MPGTLVLERFDLTATETDAGLLSSVQELDEGTAASSPPFVTPAASVAHEEDEEDTADPVAEHSQHLKALIETIQAQGATLRDRAASEMANAMAEAAETLLPSLLSSHGSFEIAAAALQIAETAKRKDISLALSPEDHEAVVDHLTSFQPSERLSVSPDKALARGTARLAWDQGGASIDQSVLIERARAAVDASRRKFQSKSTDYD